MKKILLSLSLALVSVTSFSESVDIPDANFKAYLVGKSDINTNNDTEISVAEAEDFTGIIYCPNRKIKDLTGIKVFVNLAKLRCSNNQLTSLDVRGLTSLSLLFCSSDQLTSLEVSGLTNLTQLSCGENQLTSLDVSGLISLAELGCADNQ